MNNSLYRNRTNEWENICIKHRESYYPPVDDFHTHDYYEINFIISGNVKILLPGSVDEGTDSRIVLTPPGTPHFVTCKPDIIYNRSYLLFTKKFIESSIPEWEDVLAVFGDGGRTITISAEEQDFCRMMINRLENEDNVLRQRLLVLYLLSYIGEFKGKKKSMAIPTYIMQALLYIEEHYYEKIVAAELAKILHIGRTTLMTRFKRSTALTLNNYITRCRLKNAIILLEEGNNEGEIAERCGFGDVSNFIRSFKHSLGVTPGEYIRKNKGSIVNL